ncbi:MAG: hypothetical protein ACE5J9_00795 [Methanosarcinales archaeon]
MMESQHYYIGPRSQYYFRTFIELSRCIVNITHFNEPKKIDLPSDAIIHSITIRNSSSESSIIDFILLDGVCQSILIPHNSYANVSEVLHNILQNQNIMNVIARKVTVDSDEEEAKHELEDIISYIASKIELDENKHELDIVYISDDIIEAFRNSGCDIQITIYYLLHE